MSKVFISYSHDSDAHRERVRGLHASLERDGCNCPLDLYKDTDEDWPTWMTRQLQESDFILCVITETYERRFRDQELPDQGLGVGWEAGLIRRLLYAKKLHNNRIFPIVFDKSDKEHIPIELQGYDFFLLDGSAGYEGLLRKVHNRPLYSKPATGVPPNLATSPAVPLFARPGEVPSSVDAGSKADTKADISRILKYAPAELIGREEELKLLHAAWSGDTKSRFTIHGSPFTFSCRPHILTLVALGGEGKTALVAKWAAELAAQDWPGCDATFAWSFYSQGTREQQAASSDLFLKEALTFFGDDADKAFAASPAGAFEKGQRLARLVGQRRSLLILDGLEPLQYAPTAPTPGELKDQGVAALLKGLAAASHGLCVVTTRYSLPDLRAFWQTTAPEWNLSSPTKETDAPLHTPSSRVVLFLRHFLSQTFDRFCSVLLRPATYLSRSAHHRQMEVRDSSIFAALMSLLNLILLTAAARRVGVDYTRVSFVVADTFITYSQWFLTGLLLHGLARTFGSRCSVNSSLVISLNLSAFSPFLLLVTFAMEEEFRRLIVGGAFPSEVFWSILQHQGFVVVAALRIGLFCWLVAAAAGMIRVAHSFNKRRCILLAAITAVASEIVQTGFQFGVLRFMWLEFPPSE